MFLHFAPANPTAQTMMSCESIHRPQFAVHRGFSSKMGRWTKANEKGGVSKFFFFPLCTHVICPELPSLQSQTSVQLKEHVCYFTALLLHKEFEQGETLSQFIDADKEDVE